MLNSFWWGNNRDARKGIKWLKWEKLCVHKEAGGRGFRNMHLFNVALLSKIGWRLMNDPYALVSRVLKAKYYPNCHFLDAKLGNNPSFTWTGIIEGQGLLRKGVRWKIGSGQSIRLWNMSWLSRPDNFFIQTPVVDGFNDMVVSDIISPVTGQWDRVLIEGVFSADDAKAILRTPISPVGTADRLIWHHDRSGSYTVKSGYRLASKLVENASLMEEGHWKVLWKLKIPPKIKDCLWRVCRDVLPNKVNLFRKHLVDDKWCVFCGADMETTWHTFFSCPFALNCWTKAGLRHLIEHFILQCDSVRGLVMSLLVNLPRESANLFGVLIWQIWKERNSLL